MLFRSCVTPEGRFRYTVHEPSYSVIILRRNDYIEPLGHFEDGEPHMNRVNFPEGDVAVESASTIFEVPNMFPFRGATYINKAWADENAADPKRIRLPDPGEMSLKKALEKAALEDGCRDGFAERFYEYLPEPVAIALAKCSTDPDELVRLAEGACRFTHDPATGRPVGMVYRRDGSGRTRPVISSRTRFETLANNPALPEDYRRVMVLRPGVQGESEIVGEWRSPDGRSHVFEYLRANSYIPWGHYAANMADDAVRYSISELTETDIAGMRHLYYQRTYVRLARELGIAGEGDFTRRPLDAAELESLRKQIVDVLSNPSPRAAPLSFDRTLWGWNFGFDYAPSGYRLHASHQQVHQQYAMVPAGRSGLTLTNRSGEAEMEMEPEVFPYACGDLVESFAADWFGRTGTSFFDCLVQAVRSNRRMDGENRRPSDLVVHEDENVMLFVPKAQTSQWELNLLVLRPVGNIVEAGPGVRASIDRAILTAAKVLAGLGMRMVNVSEYSARIGGPDTGQRLFYTFLPRLPESPGAFSEAQLRWINGHYPEDFAAALRASAGNADGDR